MNSARAKQKRSRGISKSRQARIQHMQGSSAFPLSFGGGSEFRIGDHGFTKLQLTAVLMAAGIRAGGATYSSADVARGALEDAEALLEEFAR